MADIVQYIPQTRSALILGAVAVVFVYAAKRLLVDPLSSNLRDIPGPKGSTLRGQGDLGLQVEWFDTYGSTIQLRLARFLGGSGLATIDPKAIGYIFKHGYKFVKPGFVSFAFGPFLGEGILFAEGDAHRRQRRALNPAFGPKEIADLLPVIWLKSNLMTDLLAKEVNASGTNCRINILPWLTRITLDVIGVAGFGHEFRALEEGSQNKMASALHDIFAPGETFPIFGMLQSRFAFLRLIPTKRGTEIRRGRKVLQEMAETIVQQRKTYLLENMDVVEKGRLQGKDMLTTLMKANLSVDLKDSERLSDREVVSQIPTLLIAGHETTSVSIAWLIWELVKPQNAHIQAKLREECRVTFAEPCVEDLNSSPYLDAVVKEGLRIYPVIGGMSRRATEDSVVPLERPFIDLKGVERHSVRISKGERTFVPISAMNRDKLIWGDDADEFRPERWFDPETTRRLESLPGVVRGLMNFTNGTRFCIGYRLAMLEMKAITFALFRRFAFSAPNPMPRVEERRSIVMRPGIKQSDGTYRGAVDVILRCLD